MNLLERVVLLLLHSAGDCTVQPSQLQLVCSRMDKRHVLELDVTEEKMKGILREFTQNQLVRREPSGYRLQEGGHYELRRIHQKNGSFCRKFLQSAERISPVFRAAA